LQNYYLFFAFIYVARIIGPEEWGIYTYLISIVSMLLPFANLSMIAEMQRKAKKLGKETVNQVFLIYLISSLFFSVAVVGAVFFQRI